MSVGCTPLGYPPCRRTRTQEKRAAFPPAALRHPRASITHIATHGFAVKTASQISHFVRALLTQFSRLASASRLWVVGLGGGSTLLQPCAVRFTLGARPATATHSPVPSPVGFAACPLPFGLLCRPARRGLRYLAHGLDECHYVGSHLQTKSKGLRLVLQVTLGVVSSGALRMPPCRRRSPAVFFIVDRSSCASPSSHHALQTRLCKPPIHHNSRTLLTFFKKTNVLTKMRPRKTSSSTKLRLNSDSTPT